MTLAATPILTAVKEVLLGTLGTTRTITAGAFQYGKHGGLNDEELARKAFVKPIVDVQFLAAERSPTTTGIYSSFGIYELALQVSVAYYLSAEPLDSSRETARALALDDGDKIIQALTYPGNVRQTSAAVSTGLVSGLLQSTGGVRVSREDTDVNLLITEMDFIGRAQVTQAVA